MLQFQNEGLTNSKVRRFQGDRKCLCLHTALYETATQFLYFQSSKNITCLHFPLQILTCLCFHFMKLSHVKNTCEEIGGAKQLGSDINKHKRTNSS